MTREEGIEHLEDMKKGLFLWDMTELIDLCISALSENKRNTAEWEIDGHHLKCPICGEYFCRTDAEQCTIPCNFCPNCGADMREPKGEKGTE